MGLFDQFVFQCNVDNSIIDKYADKVPKELISVWKEHGLGGAEKVQNLQKVKLKEHIMIIDKFMGPIQ